VIPLAAPTLQSTLSSEVSLDHPERSAENELLIQHEEHRRSVLLCVFDCRLHIWGGDCRWRDAIYEHKLEGRVSLAN